MMKLIKKTGIVLITVIMVTACGKSGGNLSPKLPEEHIMISEGTVQDPDISVPDYRQSLIWNDRDYLFYGQTFNAKKDDVKECVGYIKANSAVPFDLMVLSLVASEDFLLVYDDQPGTRGLGINVYRAADTKGKEIDIPVFIESPDEENPMYNYWSDKGEEQQ